MIKFPEVTVSVDDAREFPYHTESSIYGVKLMRLLGTDVLRKITDRDSPEHHEVLAHMGHQTNRNWIVSQAAEVLYDRSDINHLEFDQLTR